MTLSVHSRQARQKAALHNQAEAGPSQQLLPGSKTSDRLRETAPAGWPLGHASFLNRVALVGSDGLIL